MAYSKKTTTKKATPKRGSRAAKNKTTFNFGQSEKNTKRAGKKSKKT